MDGADTPLVARAAADRSPLGREEERRVLHAALRAAAGGRGGLVVVEGPAGIGKTTLLDDAQAVAPALGLDVLAARGDSLERDHPLGVVRQLLQRAATDRDLVAAAGPAAAPAVAVLDPAAVPAPGSDPGLPVLHGCWWLLQGLAATRPRLVVVDDLHWADPASLRVLAYLAGRLEELPVVLVAGLREPDDDAAPDAPPPLSRIPRIATLEPPPLAAGDAGELVGRRLGAPVSAACAAACHEVTGGNPFLLAELATALRADGVVPDDAAVARVRELGPRPVARALLLRLGRRGPDPLALARALAVLGREATLGVAGPLAGLGQQAASAAADALVRAEVLADADPLRFRHAIVRSAVLGDVGPGGRAALHASAAELLRRTGAPDADVAVHLLHAPASGSDADAATLLRAGQQALSRGAPVEALRFLGRALEEPPAADDRPDVLAGLAEAGLHARVDVRTAGERLAESAATTADPGRRVERWLLLAQLVTVGRGIPTAVGLLEEVLRQTEVEEDRRRVAVDLVGKALLHPDTRARGEGLARSAPGVTAGDTTLDRLERCNLAWALALGGAPATEVVALAGPALDGGRLSVATGPSAPVYQGIAALSQVDAVDAALACADAAVQVARDRHQTIGLYGALGTRASVRWRRGELRECADDARASLDLPGVPPPFQLVSAGWAALAALAADDPDAAAEALAAVDGAPVVENVNVHVFDAAGALLRAARGDDRAAHAALEDLDRRRRASGTRALLPWRVAHVAVALRAGDPDRAAELASAVAADAERVGTPGARGQGLHARARVATDRAVAEELLREAAGLLRGGPLRLAHAEVLVDLGEMIRRAGRPAAARAALGDGLDAARRCGALRLARRAHEELTVAGARPGRLRFSGRDALTPGERRIAGLAAAGRTNREIAQELYVTPKTVENQLSRVYRKLGIASRHDLEEALAGGG